MLKVSADDDDDDDDDDYDDVTITYLCVRPLIVLLLFL